MNRKYGIFIFLGVLVAVGIIFVAYKYGYTFLQQSQEKDSEWLDVGDYIYLQGYYEKKEWTAWGEQWRRYNLDIKISVTKVQDYVYQFEVTMNGEKFDKKLILDKSYNPWFEEWLLWIDPDNPDFWMKVVLIPPEILENAYKKYDFIYDITYMDKPAWKVESHNLVVIYEKSSGILLKIEYTGADQKINVVRTAARI
ncbi:MAG: hypothetical protein J7L51_04575 [Desulfurococcales archaeon]|nr:hypothetical protein [Desulfurococcales archaeon]